MDESSQAGPETSYSSGSSGQNPHTCGASFKPYLGPCCSPLPTHSLTNLSFILQTAPPSCMGDGPAPLRLTLDVSHILHINVGVGMVVNQGCGKVGRSCQGKRHGKDGTPKPKLSSREHRCCCVKGKATGSQGPRSFHWPGQFQMRRQESACTDQVFPGCRNECCGHTTPKAQRAILSPHQVFIDLMEPHSGSP